MEKVIYYGDGETGESISFTPRKVSSVQEKEEPCLEKRPSRDQGKYLEALRGLQMHEYF